MTETIKNNLTTIIVITFTTVELLNCGIVMWQAITGKDLIDVLQGDLIFDADIVLISSMESFLLVMTISMFTLTLAITLKQRTCRLL